MANLPPGMQIPPELLMALVKALGSAGSTPAPPAGSGIAPAGPPSLANLLGGQRGPGAPPTPLPPSAGQMSPGQTPQMLQQLLQVLSQMASGKGQGPIGGGNI